MADAMADTARWDECPDPDCAACRLATDKYWAARAPQMLALLRAGEWGYNSEIPGTWPREFPR